MSSNRRRPAWMPTPEQEQLLTAILGPKDERLAAWRSWQAAANIECLDAGSHRLLPLLWRRLLELGVEGPVMAPLKGVYRRTWYQNQIHLHRASDLLAKLHAAGIETLLLKGAALTLLHYRDVGVRPMDDLDILVPRRKAATVVDLLFGSGWVAEVTPLKGNAAPDPLVGRIWPQTRRARTKFNEAYFDVRHAHGFVSVENARVDVHWHLLQEVCALEADQAFWRAAVPVEVGDTTTLALEPADQLLHCCAHAVRWNPVPPVRWVADAEATIRSAGELLDWDRLLSQARSLAITLPLSKMLRYLARRFLVPIPVATLEALEAGPVNKRAQRAYRINVGPPGFRMGWEELRYLRRRYRALREDPSLHPLLGSFPGFVAQMIGAEHPFQVGVYAATESLRRLGRKLRLMDS